jgi:serralysin
MLPIKPFAIFVTLAIMLFLFFAANIKPKSQKNKLPIHLCQTKGLETKIVHGYDMVGEGQNLWKDKTLLVYFLDDDGKIADEVIKVASEWTPYCGIKIKKTFNRVDSDIRISFRTDGWWSYIGSYALQIPKNDATLSLDSLFLYGHENRIRNVILHEFGHALGLIHEHQHPGMSIPWIKSKLFDYYKENYGVDSSWVIKEVIDKYNSATGIYCTPDPLSIMIYAIPPGVTEDDKFVIDWPAYLSKLDKDNIKKIYTHKKCN